MSYVRANSRGGKPGTNMKSALGPDLHQRSRFRAVALGISHAEFVRLAVDNFIRQPDPAQAAMNRQTAALDRVVARVESRNYPENGGQEGGVL